MDGRQATGRNALEDWLATGRSPRIFGDRHSPRTTRRCDTSTTTPAVGGRHSRRPRVFAAASHPCDHDRDNVVAGLTMLTHKSSAELARIEARHRGSTRPRHRRVPAAHWLGARCRLPAGLSLHDRLFAGQLALVRREVSWRRSIGLEWTRHAGRW